ncbi:MAG TPA: DUF2252 family protein [Pirellulales bacterium]|jgi:hypothetical protein|nr:DUF2252 family protein [Pirellulales bacterium]
MSIHDATERYESWLGARIPLIKEDLDDKHQRMAEGPFPFFRATYYRWAQRFRTVCADLLAAPTVLGVGDLHVENFGTWRDTEGRLIWGINDFDEASLQPYANDLVRLAASALLAIENSELKIDPADACDAILVGYSATLDERGRPVVLEEHDSSLRDMAHSQERNPISFWDKLSKLKTLAEVPDFVRPLLEKLLPEPAMPYRVVHRRAGLGSLGRRRFTALAEWGGCAIAREIKELCVSAWGWQDPQPGEAEILYGQIVRQAVRIHDPFFAPVGSWILRRLGPYCSRIELANLAAKRDSQKLLTAMGRETANVHCGDAKALAAIAHDLATRGKKWLAAAARAMADDVTNDWNAWKKPAKPPTAERNPK